MARLFSQAARLLLAAAAAAHTAAAAVVYTQAALDDEVTGLPGLNYKPAFRHFSGYFNVGGGPGGMNATEGEGVRMLHYQFFESENNPETDPVVLWTNGGPGCSGLLGLYTEQGPFRPDAAGILSENPYRWNRVASMLFIEAPVGVGFSYAENPDDYKIGDLQTARDNYRLILQFLARFPQFQANPFVISSESYGGHYMPTLATEIVLQQERAPAAEKFHFKGFLVGNPFTSWMNNKVATYKTFWGHQLVSYPSYTRWEQACAHLRSPAQYFASECPRLERVLDREIGALNPYALDWPVCIGEEAAEGKKKKRQGRAQRAWLLHHATPAELRSEEKQGLGIIDIEDYAPCEDNYLTAYLNRADVKAALHVKPEIEWVECSVVTRYNVQDLLVPMEPLYLLLAGERYGLDILVYSGDDDSVCGLWGTQKWMHGLGFPLATRWQPWADAESGQPAGFVTQWANNVTLATVHGGGHEVPTYTPAVALQLFRWYLDRTWFDLTAFHGGDDEDPAAAAAPATVVSAAMMTAEAV